MDQVIQLQQQIQRLQQEINDISQVCNQLQQSEQANAFQLQQMHQKEMIATQGLRRIQQAASSLSREINTISTLAQQVATQGMQPGLSTQGYQTGFTGLTGTILPQTGMYSGMSQAGTGMGIGAQFHTPSQTAFNQGQNLASLGYMPQTSLSTPGTMQQPYAQGFQAGQFGTGNQFGYSSQAFSNQNQNLQQYPAMSVPQNISSLGTISNTSVSGLQNLPSNAQLSGMNMSGAIMPQTYSQFSSR